jgi:hypothetical protein
MDSQCSTPGTCSGASSCAGGLNKGAACIAHTDCPVSFPDYFNLGVGGCNRTCLGGANAGKPCFATSALLDCPGGTCTGTHQCNGGLFNGLQCINNSDCLAAKCVKWSCDPSLGTCRAQSGIPSCPNGQSDCDLSPYNRFCFNDPDYLKARWNNGAAGQPGVDDPGCAVDQVSCPNTCHLSTLNIAGTDYGPAVTYVCNTTTHQCLGASVPCLGGPIGAGSTCNDVCRGGTCSADFIR